MENYLQQITNFVAIYGYYFIIPLLALENIPFIGLIAPGMSVLFLTGYFGAILPGGVLSAFIISLVTIIIADSVFYFIGYHYQKKWRWLKMITSRSPNVEALLTKQSYYTLALYQFVPYLRMFLPFSLGAYHYPFKLWLRLVITASCLYTLVFFGFGYTTSIYINNLTESTSALETLSLIVAGIGLIYIGYLVFNYFKIKSQNKDINLL